jgi:carbamate kinase
VRLLVALGGNALLPRGEVPDAAAQVARISAVAPALAEVARRHALVLTHGNGPQVGLLAVESAGDRSLTRPYPFDALVAETQGLIGYWLQRALGGCGVEEVATVVTQTVVDPADPAFGAPTKFVGAAMPEQVARTLANQRGWTVRPDGPVWRRVVPSPAPVRVVEAAVVGRLLDGGATVICAGGGGSAVVDEGGTLRGVEAVVDKDAVAALLALELGADQLLLLTDVPAVVDGFGTSAARPLGAVSVAELAAREFAPGSMGPKVAAACRFASGGGTAVIGALEELDDVLAGRAGTSVRR